MNTIKKHRICNLLVRNELRIVRESLGKMTDEIYLEPDDVATIDPHVKRGVFQFSSSPFAIPKGISVSGKVPRIEKLIFRYPGSEPQAEKAFEWTDEARSSLLIFTGRDSGKIMSITFMPTITQSDLAGIGDRLIAESKKLESVSQILSFMFIGGLLKRNAEWLKVVAG